MISRLAANQHPGRVAGKVWWRKRWIQAVLVAFLLLPLWLFVVPPLGSMPDEATEGAEAEVWRAEIWRSYQELHPVWKAGSEGSGATGQLLTDWFPHRTDGIHEPLWPWLAAWVAPRPAGDDGTPSAEDQRNLKLQVLSAQRWGIGIAVCGIAMAAVLGRMMSGAAALLWGVAGGIGALRLSAADFGPEALFSVLYWLAWISLTGLFRRNTLWLYSVSGILLGLGYMTGAGTGELILAFLVVGLWRFGSDLMPALLRKGSDATPKRWNWQRHLIGMSLFISCFFLTAGPRLGDAYERHGSMFFRMVNYWRWLDSPEQARNFENQWSELGEAEREYGFEDRLPSWKSWLATHSLDEAGGRIGSGLRESFSALFPMDQGIAGFFSRGWMAAWVAILTAFLLFALRYRSGPPAPGHPRQRWPEEAEGALIFVVAALEFHLVFHAWDVQASPRPLGVGGWLALAPLLFCLLWAAESARKRIVIRFGPAWISPAAQAVYLILAGLCLLSFR